MKVKKLIELLKKENPEATVVFATDGFWVEVAHIYRHEQNVVYVNMATQRTKKLVIELA